MQKLIKNEEYDNIDHSKDNMEQKIKLLWDAVRSMRQQDVESQITGGDIESLLNKTPNGESTTILQEAHLRGDTEILKALSSPRNYLLSDLALIKSVARVYAERVNLIFTACKRGQYSGPGGVEELLRGFRLPGTVQDSSGSSLLHCAVSAKVIPSGEPLWDLNDLENLVNDHHCNVNARNFLGETALHNLVTIIEENPGTKQTAVSEGWLQITKHLLKLGCNPGLADYSNKTPAMLVNYNSSLRELLSQDDHSKDQSWPVNKKIQFILNASRMGENQIITMITQSGMPSFGPTLCPIHEGIDNNHRDTVILLQSSRLPLFSRTTKNTMKYSEMPVIYTALVEMEICNNLQQDMRKISKNNKLYQELLSYMQNIQKKVNNEGIRLILSPSTNDDYNSRYKELIVHAASLGLTYTCRILQLTSNYTNFYHSESNPVQEALKNKHIHTAMVLCVDLQIYYSMDSLGDHKQFQSSLFSIELSIFKYILSTDKRISEVDKQKMAEYLETLKDIGEPEYPDNRLIHIITKSGLIALLHHIQANTHFDLNRIINNHINSTILHIAIIYERVNIIEYLVYMKADFQMCMLEDLNAWPLSKIVGNVSCQNAVRQHIEKSETTMSDFSKDALNDLKNKLESDMERISSDASNEDCEFEKECLDCLIEKIDQSVK